MMRRDVPPQKISKFHLFPSLPVSNISTSKDIFKISKNGEYIWTAHGCTLEVFTCPHMRRVNQWSFPSLSKNSDVYISAIEEVPSIGGGASSMGTVGPSGHRFNAAPYLLVALAGVNYLCLFDICNARVFKCIQMPLPITSLEIVTYQGGACLQTRPVFPSLRLFFGIVAVGTEGGHLLLVDLCLDETEGSNELQPAQLFEIVSPSMDIAQTREQALENNEHLFMSLPGGNYKHGSSTLLYKGPQNKTLGVFSSDDSYITTILYVPQATLLVVGFNFGGFQLWNLQDLSIIFASTLCPDINPVVKFAFQEPENDPRNYCYLWAVYGQSSQDPNSESSITTASLYSLSYERRIWQEGFGFLYQGFNHCFLRFEHPLTVDPFNQANEADRGGSRLISFGMIQDNHLTASRQHDIEDPQNDEWSNQDLSLCLMVWEAWDFQEPPCYFMLIFDINQWYQAQMPTTVRNPGLCSFLGVFSLVEVMESKNVSSDFTLKDVHIPLESLQRFRSLLPVDEVYYPSSFAFKCTCLMDCGVVEVSYLGTQRQLLWELQNLGPAYLREPTEMFIHCRHSGLLTRSESVSLNQKREALLSLALEYDLLPYLKDCVHQTPTVDHNSGGLTLRFITDWAWKRTSQIKSAIDRLCLPLFNCSGQELDQGSLALLYNYSSQLHALACLYRIIQSQVNQNITQSGFEELSVQEEVIQLLCVYLQVILWLQQYCCLLPEHAEGEAYGENEVAYPASLLAQSYDQRRQDLHKLHNSIGPTDLLLIDGLMSKLNGQVPMHWERSANTDASSTVQRLYPPPSLFAFLNIYLISGVDIMHKHCLTLYLLLDMADFLSHKQSHLEERLMQFPAAFRMPPSVIKIVQGFWMLDRKDFAKATSFLTDPVVRSWDLDHMLHSRVMKSLLYQGQEKHALTYMHIRKPPLDTPEDIKLHLSLLLANRLIVEAHCFQRQRADDDLLNHLFLGCLQTGNMCALLELPLNPMEEQALIKFLSDSSHPTAKEMLILFLLQRHRPLEALDFTDKFNRKDEPGTLCTSLVKQFVKILPPAQVHLSKEHSKPYSRKYQGKESVTLSSMTVRGGHVSNPVSKANQLQTVKEAFYNMWFKRSIDPQTPLRTRETRTISSEALLLLQTPPVKRQVPDLKICTPSAGRSHLQVPGPPSILKGSQTSSTTRTSRTPDLKPIYPQLNYAEQDSGDLSETDMEIQECVSSSPSEGGDYEDEDPLTSRQHETSASMDQNSGSQVTSDVNISDDMDQISSPQLTGDINISDEIDSVRTRRISDLPSLDITFGSPSLHKSDEIVIEDEDVTLNFTMQRRREDLTSSLRRAHLRKPSKTASFLKNINEQMKLVRTSVEQSEPVGIDPSKSLITQSVDEDQKEIEEENPVIEGHQEDVVFQEQYASCDSEHVSFCENAFSHDLPHPSSSQNLKETDIFVDDIEMVCESVPVGSTTNVISSPANLYEPVMAGTSITLVTSSSETNGNRASVPSQSELLIDSTENIVNEDLKVASEEQPVLQHYATCEVFEIECEEPPVLNEDTDISQSEQEAEVKLGEFKTSESYESSNDEVSILGSIIRKDDRVRENYDSRVMFSNVEGDDCNVVSSQVSESCAKVEINTLVHAESSSLPICDRLELSNAGLVDQPEVSTSEHKIAWTESSNKSAHFVLKNQETFSDSVRQLPGSGTTKSDFAISHSFKSQSQLQDVYVDADKTGPFEVNPVDSTMDVTSTTECLPKSSQEPSSSSTKDQHKKEGGITPSSQVPITRTRATRRKVRESADQVHTVPLLTEALPVSSPDQSPSSSVFTTPEKSSSVSVWNARLRRRSESHTSSDSSPHTVGSLSEKRKTRTRQWSNTPSPQLTTTPQDVEVHRVTRSGRKGQRQKVKEIEHQKRSLSIPEEPEELPEEAVTPKSALPFVFSPPATRSWTRRKKSDTPDKNSVQDGNTSIGIGLLPSQNISVIQEKKEETGPSSSDWENYINLISPFTGKETKQQRRSSVASRTSTSSRHTMTLRTGVLKTRKIVKLK